MYRTLVPPRDLEITPAENINEIRTLLSALRTANASLKNFKGIGNIKVWHRGNLQLDQRVAWIGEKPVKLSIAVLISGYPAIKLATDGEWLYYLEAQENETKFRKIPTKDPDLNKIISIPIPVSDALKLLTGQIPMRDFNAVTFIEETNGVVLVLEEKWWGIREKIYLNKRKSEVRQIEIFRRSGALSYRAEIERHQRVGEYQVPMRLKLSNDEGADFQLDIDRIWVNVDLPQSVFVLTPPTGMVSHE